MAVERYGIVSGANQLNAMIHAIKLVLNATKQLEEANLKYGNWSFKVKNNLPLTPEVVYNQITQNLMDPLHDVLENYLMYISIYKINKIKCPNAFVFKGFGSSLCHVRRK